MENISWPRLRRQRRRYSGENVFDKDDHPWVLALGTQLRAEHTDRASTNPRPTHKGGESLFSDAQGSSGSDQNCTQIPPGAFLFQQTKSELHLADDAILVLKTRVVQELRAESLFLSSHPSAFPPARQRTTMFKQLPSYFIFSQCFDAFLIQYHSHLQPEEYNTTYSPKGKGRPFRKVMSFIT
ncbi:unnamed protein product [Nesidiocoris tenuis]|uniref:Uncharacterized protein n=1 Tax=Nesidiocoris tenuis TaxID=355587 RepID=A0A6H5G048_9HEMI|nr:unnamed protein product [Nesidiocoris tenuis]